MFNKEKKIQLKGNEKILIVRTDRIGDLILSTPVAEALKQKFPQAQIDFLVAPYTSPILKNDPFINEIILDDNKSVKGFLKLKKVIKQKKYDVAIVLHPTLRLAGLLKSAGVPYRIGSGYRGYSFLFNVKHFQHRKTVEKHELEYNLDMLRVLGVGSQKILPKLYLSPNEKNEADVFLKKLGIKNEDIIVLIHPGSGGNALTWATEKFGGLADKLINSYSVKVLVTGQAGEKILAEKMKSKMKHSFLDLTGKTDLRLLSSIIEKSDLVICNSTGPMHIAASLGIPTVALFCPIFTASPKRWGPYGEGHTVILPPVPPCKNCSATKCEKGNCIDLITVEEVFEKTGAVLKSKTKIEK